MDGAGSTLRTLVPLIWDGSKWDVFPAMTTMIQRCLIRVPCDASFSETMISGVVPCPGLGDAHLQHPLPEDSSSGWHGWLLAGIQTYYPGEDYEG